eukprot:m.89371 g.89371  ORF g.89371 m.89371 type:complete len:329 (-) comp11738_c0_seq3:7151-8137(-)
MPEPPDPNPGETVKAEVSTSRVANLAVAPSIVVSLSTREPDGEGAGPAEMNAERRPRCRSVGDSDRGREADADVFTSDDFWSRSSSLTSHNSDSSLNEDRAFRMRMKARQGEGHPGRPRSIDLSIADVITRPRSRSSSRSSDRGLDNSLRGIEEAEEEEEEEEGAQTGDSVWEAATKLTRTQSARSYSMSQKEVQRRRELELLKCQRRQQYSNMAEKTAQTAPVEGRQRSTSLPECRMPWKNKTPPSSPKSLRTMAEVPEGSAPISPMLRASKLRGSRASDETPSRRSPLSGRVSRATSVSPLAASANVGSPKLTPQSTTNHPPPSTQ